MPGHDLLLAGPEVTWVLDQALLRLCAFTVEHEPPVCRELPPTLRDRLLAYRRNRVEALERATGQQVTAAPVAKDMVNAGGQIAVLLTLPEMPIVLLDPADGSVTPVMIDPTAVPDWLRSARSFDWNGRAFVTAGDDGIGRIVLSRAFPANY